MFIKIDNNFEIINLNRNYPLSRIGYGLEIHQQNQITNKGGEIVIEDVCAVKE